jgi:hypothetical protein
VVHIFIFRLSKRLLELRSKPRSLGYCFTLVSQKKIFFDTVTTKILMSFCSNLVKISYFFRSLVAVGRHTKMANSKTNVEKSSVQSRNMARRVSLFCCTPLLKTQLTASQTSITCWITCVHVLPVITFDFTCSVCVGLIYLWLCGVPDTEVKIPWLTCRPCVVAKRPWKKNLQYSGKTGKKERMIALRPHTPKLIRGGWSHYTDTSGPVDG